MAQFAGNSVGIGVEVEVFATGQSLEMRTEAAVVASGDVDVATFEHVRIALRAGGLHAFEEGEVRILVAEVVTLSVEAQNALVAFSFYRHAVADEDGLKRYA